MATFELGSSECHQQIVALITATVHNPGWLPGLIAELDADDRATIVHSFAIGTLILLRKVASLTGQPLNSILVAMGLYAAEADIVGPE